MTSLLSLSFQISIQIVELSVLSSWKEMVKGQIEERISKLKQNFKQPTGCLKYLQL